MDTVCTLGEILTLTETRIRGRSRLGVLKTWVLVSRRLETEFWKSWSWSQSWCLESRSRSWSWRSLILVMVCPLTEFVLGHLVSWSDVDCVWLTTSCRLLCKSVTMRTPDSWRYIQVAGSISRLNCCPICW